MSCNPINRNHHHGAINTNQPIVWYIAEKVSNTVKSIFKFLVDVITFPFILLKKIINNLPSPPPRQHRYFPPPRPLPPFMYDPPPVPHTPHFPPPQHAPIFEQPPVRTPVNRPISGQRPVRTPVNRPMQHPPIFGQPPVTHAPLNQNPQQQEELPRRTPVGNR